MARFNALIDFAGGHGKPFGHDFEVMDQGLHLGLHLFPVRQHDLGRVGFHRAFGHPVQRLLNDLHALAHLHQPNCIARPAVAVSRERNLELEFLIAGIRHIPAQVEVHSRGAQRGSSHAQRNGVGRREKAHALQPALEDRVAGQQVGILVDLFPEGADECLHPVQEVQRRLHRQAADPDVAGHHPLPGHGLKESQDVFALAESVQKDRERANIHGVRPQPDKVRIEAAQLSQQHPQPLRFVGNLQAKQLFDCQGVTQIVRQRVQIVDAVRQRHHLLIELGLAGLLNAGVQIADLRIKPHNDLTVNLQHQAQNAMRRRVLRAHIQHHVLVLGA